MFLFLYIHTFLDSFPKVIISQFPWFTPICFWLFPNISYQICKQYIYLLFCRHHSSGCFVAALPGTRSVQLRVKLQGSMRWSYERKNGNHGWNGRMLVLVGWLRWFWVWFWFGLVLVLGCVGFGWLVLILVGLACLVSLFVLVDSMSLIVGVELSKGVEF